MDLLPSFGDADVRIHLRPAEAAAAYSTSISFELDSASVGLIQYYMARVYTFPKAMKWFYGDEARAVSFSFSTFENSSGVIYRLPSTFTFVTPYSNFLLFALCACLMAVSIEKNKTWRLISYGTAALVICACVLCGSRAMLFFTPLVIVLYFCIGKSLKFGVLAGTVFVVFSTVFSRLFNFNPLGAANHFSSLIALYLFEFAPYQILGAVAKYPFGLGTGAATNQVRHLSNVVELNKQVANEAFFARAIIELGLPGFVITLALLTIPCFVSGWSIYRSRDKALKSICAALFVYQFFICLSSLKSNPIDQDPANVYFWITAGMTFRIRAFLNSQAQGAKQVLQEINLPTEPKLPELPLSRYPVVAKAENTSIRQ